MKRTFTIFCLILALTALYAGTALANQPKPSAPNQPAYLKSIPPDKLKQDLDFLFKTIEEVHPNMYAYVSQEKFKPLKEQLYERISSPMKPLDFYKVVAPVVASLKSGHTFMYPPSFKKTSAFGKYVKNGGKIFPLALDWDGERAILAGNYTDQNLPLGGVLLEINGQDASVVIKRLSRYFPAERRHIFPWQMERVELLRPAIWLEYGPVELLNIRIKAIDYTTSDYVINFTTSDKIKTKEVPNNKKNSYRYFTGCDTYLIRLNDWSSLEGIKKFCNEVFEKIRDQKASNLIIDIRNNPGGNSTCAEAFIEHLTDQPYYLFEEAQVKLSTQFCSRYGVNVPSDAIGTMWTMKGQLKQSKPNPLRFKGRVYLLAGVRSTSTSTAFAAAIKYFGIASIIGEETADPTTVYGNAFDFNLPNSNLRVLSACQIYVCAGSKNDSHGVIPDYEVKQKPEDTAKGVDTVLQFTLDLIKESNSKIMSKHKTE